MSRMSLEEAKKIAREYTPEELELMKKPKKTEEEKQKVKELYSTVMQARVIVRNENHALKGTLGVFYMNRDVRGIVPLDMYYSEDTKKRISKYFTKLFRNTIKELVENAKAEGSKEITFRATKSSTHINKLQGRVIELEEKLIETKKDEYLKRAEMVAEKKIEKQKEKLRKKYGSKLKK